MINIQVKNPTPFKVKELNPQTVRKGLRKIANLVKKDAQSRLNGQGPSNANDYPHKLSGDLRRAVQVVMGKRNKMWTKVQIGTIYSREKGTQKRVKKDWYAGPLNYGRHSGDLRPRKNPIVDAQNSKSKAAVDTLEQVLIDAIEL